MDRSHATDFPIHDLLRIRWSPRAFADRPIEPAKLCSLMEAARWAPSCYNEQPWRMIVIQKEDAAQHERAIACLSPGNQVWARAAPILMVSAGVSTFLRNGTPNRWAGHDVGQAVAHMTVQAISMGIYIHQMGGFDVAAAKRALGLPDTVEPMAFIAAGYPGDPHTLPEDVRKKEMTPSTRRPAAESVFSGSWGKPAPWLQR